MANSYLKVTPVPGKWYVSERFPASKTRWTIIDAAQPEVKRSTTEMILAGPFDTRILAVNWNTLANASGYIWEKEMLDAPKPALKKKS